MTGQCEPVDRELPDVRMEDTWISGDNAKEFWEQKDRYSYQGQFMLVMRMLRRAGWTVEPPPGHERTQITWKDSPVLADDLLHVEPDGSVTAKTGLPPSRKETWS